MKNVLKKVAIASALVAASSASFSDEIGNVQVDVNYVSTCTVTNAPAANFTDIVPGTLPVVDLDIELECSSSSDTTSVGLWLNTTALYAEDTEHFVFFLNENEADASSYSGSSPIATTSNTRSANAPVVTLTPGTNNYTVRVRAALGSFNGIGYQAPTVYDSVSLQVPVNVEF